LQNNLGIASDKLDLGSVAGRDVGRARLKVLSTALVLINSSVLF